MLSADGDDGGHGDDGDMVLYSPSAIGLCKLTNFIHNLPRITETFYIAMNYIVYRMTVRVSVVSPNYSRPW